MHRQLYELVADDSYSYSECMCQEDALQVVKYWELHIHKDVTLPIVGDGCADLILELYAPHCTFLSVSPTEPISLSLAANSAYFGTRFAPGALNTYFDQNLAGTSGSHDAVHFLPEVMIFLLAQLPGLTDRASVMQHHLSQRAAFDPKQQTIIDLIADPSKESGYSKRQMQRLYHQYVGMSPVKVSRILRAQHALNDLLHTDNALTTSYFDQSHQIREFKSVFGLTPQQILRGAKGMDV